MCNLIEETKMQIISELDDNLIEEAFQLTGLKTQQALIEKAVKELIASYQSQVKKNQWQKTISDSQESGITRGDKTIDPSDLFGLWEKQPKELSDIRKLAWQR
jgi:Arc/MetJ family transcription regulator